MAAPLNRLRMQCTLERSPSRTYPAVQENLVSLRSPLFVDESEVQVTAIRAQGPGGQNVNKVSSAIQLRFDIPASSLPEGVKERLLALADNRITAEGELILKAQRYRTQDMNRMDAFSRLHELIHSVAVPPKQRKPTKPSYGAVQKRLQSKSQRSDLKARRGSKDMD